MSCTIAWCTSIVNYEYKQSFKWCGVLQHTNFKQFWWFKWWTKIHWTTWHYCGPNSTRFSSHSAEGTATVWPVPFIITCGKKTNPNSPPQISSSLPAQGTPHTSTADVAHPTLGKQPFCPIALITRDCTPGHLTGRKLSHKCSLEPMFGWNDSSEAGKLHTITPSWCESWYCYHTLWYKQCLVSQHKQNHQVN